MEFDDHEAFEVWLTRQSREVLLAVGARAALRTWPVLLAFRNWNDKAGSQYAHERLAVFSAWGLMLTAAAAVRPSSNDSRLAVASAFAVDAAAATAAKFAADSRAMAAAAGRAAASATSAIMEGDSAQIQRVLTETRRAAIAASHVASIAADSALRSDAAKTPDQTFAQPLWHSEGSPKTLRKEDLGQTLLDTDLRFDFFKRWYAGMVRGEPLDWELQRRVVLIPRETWEAGADAVAEAIAEIEAEWEAEQVEAATSAPVTEKELSVVVQRVEANRDALAVSTASLLEQLDTFRERIRGMNALDPELRDEILAFIDGFRGQLDEMLHDLPPPGEEVGEERGNRLVRWLRGYRAVLVTKLAHYSSPENVGEATIPTAIILSASGIGGMMSQPLAGAVVGGLIVNQMKPGQAAKELVKPQDGNDGSAG